MCTITLSLAKPGKAMPGPYSSLMHATEGALSRFAERGEIRGHRHRRARWSIHSGQRRRHAHEPRLCRRPSGEARDRLWRSGSRPSISVNPACNRARRTANHHGVDHAELLQRLDSAFLLRELNLWHTLPLHDASGLLARLPLPQLDESSHKDEGYAGRGSLRASGAWRSRLMRMRRGGGWTRTG